MSEPSWARTLDQHLAYRRKSDAGRVAELWSIGFDTLDISRSMSLPEPYICLLLAEMQDEQHAKRIHGGARA